MIFNQQAVQSGGGGGATEYTIQGERRNLFGIMELVFPLSNTGLSSSDFDLQSGNVIWIEFDSAASLYVWQDQNEDDTFDASIPAGTKAYACRTGLYPIVVSFSSANNASFGWLSLQYDDISFSDDVILLASYGDGIDLSCIAQTSRYGTTKTGAAHIPYSTIPSISLHILKTS